MNFDFGYALDQFLTIASYTGMTLKISVVTMVITVVFALAITFVRYYKIKVLTRIVNIYIDLFRGTPLLVQLFFIYFGLPQLFPSFVNMTGYTAAVIGLTLNTAAYMTEDMRGALSSVSKGQIEGGLSLGMTNMQVMWHIILPQATRVALPVLGNEFIALIKNSSMAFTLGVREIMAEAFFFFFSSCNYLETYLDAFIIYFILCKLVTILQKFLEKRLSRRGGANK